MYIVSLLQVDRQPRAVPEADVGVVRAVAAARRGRAGAAGAARLPGPPGRQPPRARRENVSIARLLCTVTTYLLLLLT